MSNWAAARCRPVRVELLPFALNRYGLSAEDVRAALQSSAANRPKGAIESNGRRLQVYSTSGVGTGAQRVRLPRAGRRVGATAPQCA